MRLLAIMGSNPAPILYTYWAEDLQRALRYRRNVPMPSRHWIFSCGTNSDQLPTHLVSLCGGGDSDSVDPPATNKNPMQHIKQDPTDDCARRSQHDVEFSKHGGLVRSENQNNSVKNPQILVGMPTFLVSGALRC